MTNRNWQMLGVLLFGSFLSMCLLDKRSCHIYTLAVTSFAAIATYLQVILLQITHD